MKYQEMECNELPNDEKKIYYEALLQNVGEERIQMLRLMIAKSGVEVATATVIGNMPNNGVGLPQRVLDAIYNACLYIHSQAQHN